ncbi:MAG: tRNA (N(6)-L-threonylcarbamoyladenosine(37)-C(2))-methylthiotransferase MtaB [Clostridia bacterium]|nr:tRNA (N(6)-L-threonylcarbamoyladenosine(37)-C(2))-methylthiotransferase MtaB [Clostridia bacterium]
MKSVAFYTLGCKVNQYETNAMEKLFSDAGYEIVPFDGFADVYVINTCTVTSVGDKKSRQVLRRARGHNKNAVIAAVGCMAQTAPQKIKELKIADVIIGTNKKNEIVKTVEEAAREKKTVSVVETLGKDIPFEAMVIDNFEDRERAYIKIQEGCDRFCTYCIIPFARGAVRSAREDDIISQAKTLSQKGFSEIVLTGIHVASYGRGTDNTLHGLLQKISDIDGIKRIRLSSIDPVAFTDDFIETVSRLPKVCPHYHISLQSGSDIILKKMNRRYTSAEYMETLQRIRAKITDVAITTDVITGFPYETDEEFQKSLEFVKKAEFSGVHVFPYSEREGTAAAKFKESVPKSLRAERAHVMGELAKELKSEFLKKYIGKKMPVLFEKKHRDNLFEGFTPNYMRVACEADDSIVGKIAEVSLETTDGEMLFGTLIR